MKKIIGVLIFMLAFSTNMDLEAKTTTNNEITFESCVSIAGDVSGGNPYYFQLAYNYCIYSRCDCF